jgi:hypothetical protein
MAAERTCATEDRRPQGEEYKEERPHSALVCVAPREFVRRQQGQKLSCYASRFSYDAARRKMRQVRL